MCPELRAFTELRAFKSDFMVRVGERGGGGDEVGGQGIGGGGVVEGQG